MQYTIFFAVLVMVVSLKDSEYYSKKLSYSQMYDDNSFEVVNEFDLLDMELNQLQNHLKIVLTIDVSGSMEYQKRLEKSVCAIKHWLTYVVPDAVMIGIVEFNSFAEVLNTVVSVNASSRQKLIKRLPIFAQGESEITLGLHKAMEVLGTDSEDYNVVFLITDEAEEQQSAKIKDRNLVLDVLKLTHRSLNKLRSFKIHDATVVTGMVSALTKALNLFTTSTSLQTLFEMELTKESREMNISTHFAVNSLSHQIEACVYYSYKCVNSLIMTQPDGQIVAASVNSTSTVVHLQEKMMGNWGLQAGVVDHDACMYVAIIVVAVQPDISVICSTATGLNSMEKQTLLTAYVTHDELPVLHAFVNITIAGHDGIVADQLQLYDNGCGADVVANDGLYSRYFLPPLPGVQMYSVTCYAITTVNSSVIFEDGNEQQLDPHLQAASKALPFTAERSTSEFPPCKINDLKIESMTEKSVTLTWTAPGNRLDHGKADAYYLLCSTKEYKLKNHTKGHNIRKQKIQVTPAPFGDPEKQQIDLLPECREASKMYFAVTAVGTSGLVGPVSNVVIVSQLYPAIPVDSEAPVGSFFIPLLIVMVVFGLLIVLFCLNSWYRNTHFGQYKVARCLR